MFGDHTASWYWFDDPAAMCGTLDRLDTVYGIVSNNNPYVEGHKWPIFFAVQH
jgi:hypothetical protein